MRLLADCGGPARVVSISIDSADATIGDLAIALGVDAEAGLVVDGVAHRAEVLLRDVALVEGALVETTTPGRATAGSGTTWVGVVRGPDAGAIARLEDAASATIGTDPYNDLTIVNDTVSARHATIQLSEDADGFVVQDLGSRNGSWTDETEISKPTKLAADQQLRVGSSFIAVRSVDRRDEHLGMRAHLRDERGRLLVNRPPRPLSLARHEPISLPEPLAPRSTPTLAVVSLLLPLVMAGVMVMVLGSWRYAIFGLLSPLMALGNWISARRSAKRATAGDVQTHKKALEQLHLELEAAESNERQRRRALTPDVMELRRRIELPSSRLWERRMTGDDAFVLRLGVGTIDWRPDTNGDVSAAAEDVQTLLRQSDELTDIEVLVDLKRGALGLVGDNEQLRDVASSLLVQLSTHHGPADMRLAILTSPDRLDDWSWTQWLPHVARGDGGVDLLAGDAARSFAAALPARRDGDHHRPALVIVCDDVALLHERSSALREALDARDGRVFGILLASRRDELPSSVVSIASIENPDGAFELRTTDGATESARGVVDTVTSAVALDLARALARFEDPERVTLGGGVPTSVTAVDVWGDAFDHEQIWRRWLRSKRDTTLAAALGVTQQGPLTIDLVHDGPHGLVAGTTGAGKSELLRSMIVGLAANYGPDDLVFVLVDYKGGSAFDACADLPHVVGMVTDLDDHLAGRALRSLDAELHHREEMLRSCSAKDIDDYRAQGSPRGPLPRLVVVIDEFATLRAELPEFVHSLVSVAQRGRSLGLHLVLATQRPAGAVDANIKANTNLRISLRVQDSADSKDVIDAPDAAMIPRTTPGRAFVRRGDGDLTLVQSIYVSGPMPAEGPRVWANDVHVGDGAPPTIARPAQPDGATTELSELVEACRRAAQDHAAPRRPWTEPLPAYLAGDAAVVASAVSDGTPVEVALGDDPDAQRFIRRGWEPATGHLAVVGFLGSGVTTTLRSTVISLGRWAANNRDPHGLSTYVVDHGSGGMVGIDTYGHVASRIDGGDLDRQSRLLSMLRQELERRQDTQDPAATHPLIAVVIDGVAGFAAALDLDPGSARGDEFATVVRDGPAVGIVFVVGAQQVGELPRSLRNSLRNTLVLEQRDANSYGDFGLRGSQLPAFSPGRGVWAEDSMVLHVIDWEANTTPDEFDMLEPPLEIESLGTDIGRSVLPRATVRPELDIPVAIGERSREPVSLRLRPGEHAIVAGPSGSGRSSTLALVAAALREADPELILVGVAPSSSPVDFDSEVFDAGGSYDDLERVLASAGSDDRRWVIVVDDADRLELDRGPLFELARTAPANVNLILGLRSASARQAYGHWSRFVRASGVGVLLQPDNGVDGDLLSVRLPRHERLPAAPGRGYLVQAGSADVVQICR